MVFSALSDDLTHVLWLFTLSAVAAVDDRFQGRVLVKVSVSALLPIMILIEVTLLLFLTAALSQAESC